MDNLNTWVSCQYCHVTEVALFSPNLLFIRKVWTASTVHSTTFIQPPYSFSLYFPRVVKSFFFKCLQLRVEYLWPSLQSDSQFSLFQTLLNMAARSTNKQIITNIFHNWKKIIWVNPDYYLAFCYKCIILHIWAYYFALFHCYSMVNSYLSFFFSQDIFSWPQAALLWSCIVFPGLACPENN